MHSFSDKIVIACPPEAFVAALRDPALWQAVLPACKGVEALGEGHLRARIERRVGPLPLRVEPEIRVTGSAGRAVVALSGGSLVAGRVEAGLELALRPVPGAVRIDYAGQVEATGLAGRILAERGPEVARRVRSILNAIKARLEAA